MKQQYGILLLEKTEVILRVYEVNNKDWRLLFTQNKELREKNTDAPEIIEIIADLLMTKYTQRIDAWKLCSRSIPDAVIYTISSATGFAIENLTFRREQELLCKGILTELW